MAFSARAHWHGYLMVFAHGSILHPWKDSSGNSQQSHLAVSMLEKKETISSALTAESRVEGVPFWRS
jgi:hypothetical protein